MYFFCKQKTAYEMRISDWSSDVCSSDLKASNIVDRMSGQTLNAMAKGAALSRFESAKQRFWSQILISMKMPTVIRAIGDELAADHVAVEIGRASCRERVCKTV